MEKQKTLSYKKSFWCFIGLHDWYKGNFSYPVWGRHERHCLECDKRQYAKYENQKCKWIDFKPKIE